MLLPFFYLAGIYISLCFVLNDDQVGRVYGADLLGAGAGAGLVLALMQKARARPFRWLAWIYLWLFRGTPVLLQIIFAFNVLPAFGVILSGPVCAVLALGLHEAAYMTEIIRGGLGAVSAGQRDAARALGMSEWQVMRLVALPQALRLVIPPIGNQFIGMLKLSALVSVIGVRELLLAAEQSASGTFRYLEALSAAGLYYLAFTTVLMSFQHMLERRFGRSGRLDMGPGATGGRRAIQT